MLRMLGKGDNGDGKLRIARVYGKSRVLCVKSAYELAMERLQKTAPVQPLSPEKKAALAEIDSRYRAKVAQKEIQLGDEIQQAVSSGDYVRADEMRATLTAETAKLEREREEKKEALRQS